MTLYHYTCSHGADGIIQTGEIMPNPLTGLAWFTDLEEPDRSALGLTSHLLDCDRMSRRIIVADEQDIRPWHQVRKFTDPTLVYRLEAVPGVFLMHWYVSAVPVKALLP